MKKLIKRFRAKTPVPHKISGRLTTILAVVSSAMLADPTVQSKPILFAAVSIISASLGVLSGYHGAQVLK